MKSIFLTFVWMIFGFGLIVGIIGKGCVDKVDNWATEEYNKIEKRNLEDAGQQTDAFSTNDAQNNLKFRHRK